MSGPDDKPRRGDNAPFLAACSARIADAILEFCTQNTGRTFHADELRRHVSKAAGSGAPASADRVLRHLRQRGEVNYVVVNRAHSLYRIEAARTAAEKPADLFDVLNERPAT